MAELCALGDLVLFTAALPNQGGTNHLNEQWPGYWAALFAEHGFSCFDVLRPRTWNRDDCDWWYVHNVLLFARGGTPAHAAASRLGPPCTPASLVHPRMLAHVVESAGGRIGMLERELVNQRSGRDEAIRVLEARLDQMQAEAVERTAAAAALDALLGQARAECRRWMSDAQAVRSSTSWCVTAPQDCCPAEGPSRARLSATANRSRPGKAGT